MQRKALRMEAMPDSLMAQLNLTGKKLSKSHQKIADYLEKHYEKAV